MQAVHVHCRHFNGRQPSGLNKNNFDYGAYARDKNTSARFCAKNAGGLMREGGGVFAGHQGIYILVTRPPVFALMF